MTAALPAPLVPAEVDLRDFSYIPIDIVRLFGSEFHALTSDAEWRAGLTLWCKSYHQVPASSIPDDDIALARLAEFGRDVKAWKKVRTKALHGWMKCSDGLLYHPVVAEKALEAWVGKLHQRKSSAAGNAKRHGNKFDTVPFDAAIAETLKRLAQLNPGSRTLMKRAVKVSDGALTGSPDDLPARDGGEAQQPPDGIPVGDDREAIGSPDDLPAGSQGKGRGRGISSVLTDGGPSPPADPAVFRSVLDQPPLRLVPAEPEPLAITDPSAAERELFARAKAVAGANFGGQVPKLLKAKGGNIALARAAVEMASTKHNPREYLARVIRGDDTGLPAGQLYDRSI